MKQLVVTLAMLAGLQLGLHAQTYSTLYTFDDGTDGNTISGKLILDTNGNLYGESSGGGSTNCTPRCGTVFELTPNNGVWTKTILYNFLGGTNDGAYPFGGLAFDTAGNIYGTTTAGGLTKSRWNLCEDGCGTIFELSHPVKTAGQRPSSTSSTTRTTGLCQSPHSPQMEQATSTG
jgi:hypothetical protein